MAGLPWFELDVEFHENPKIRALASRLREPLADAYVSRIYAYCYRHAVDRFDPSVAAETLEEAARWRKRRGVLFDALFATGILERDAGKVVVHGVAERLAPHLAKRQGDAERQRRRRDKAAKSIGRLSVVTPDVTRDEPRDVTPDVPRESRRDSNKDRDRDKKPFPLARPLQSNGSAGGRRTKVCLGPKGAVFAASCARGLGHSLAPLGSSDEADLLERRVLAHGGPEAAKDYVAAACRRRDNFDPQSVKLLLDMLGDPLPPEAKA